MQLERAPLLRRISVEGRHVALWDWEPSVQTPAETDLAQGSSGVRAISPPTVVLIHAAGFHGRCWDEVVRLLPSSYRIICADVPGHGLSDGPPDNCPRWHHMADDIDAALKTVGVKPEDVALLVGHSLGGWICTKLVAGNLNKFRSLLLIDPVIFPREKYGKGMDPQSPAVRAVANRTDTFDSAEGMFERYENRDPYANWQKKVKLDYFNHALSRAPDGKLRLRCRPEYEAAVYTTGGTLEANISNEVENLASARQHVVVLRAGAGETHFARSPTDPDLARRLGPCAKDVVMADADHFIPMTRPREVAKYILALSCDQVVDEVVNIPKL